MQPQQAATQQTATILEVYSSGAVWEISVQGDSSFKTVRAPTIDKALMLFRKQFPTKDIIGINYLAY